MALFNRYPFRNLIRDYNANFEYITSQAELPFGTPASGPAVTPAGNANVDLDLSFNRHGRKRSLPHKQFKLFKRTFRLFESTADALKFIEGNRCQGSFIRVWRFVVRN